MTRKEIKTLAAMMVKRQVDLDNGVKPAPLQGRYALAIHEMDVRIQGEHVTIGGVKTFLIERKYSRKKIEGGYMQLAPKLYDLD